MKKILKYILSVFITILVSYGIVIAWNGLTASDGDTLDFTKWNQLVEKISGINTLANGYVGIGTSTPNSLLNVVNNIDRDGPGILFGLNQPASGINPWSGLDLLTEGTENFHYTNGNASGSKGWRFTAHNTSSSFYDGDLALWTWSGNTFQRHFMVEDTTGNWIFGPDRTPVNRMDIDGSVGIGSNYAGFEVAPLNGMIVEGNVGIGTSSPSTKLHVAGTITEDSDFRLKENISHIDNSLEKVLQLEGVTYNWKNTNKYNDKLNMGVIAQDVEKVFPEVVNTDINGYKSVEYSKLIAPLIEAIKEQQIQIDELKKQLNNQ